VPCIITVTFRFYTVTIRDVDNHNVASNLQGNIGEFYIALEWSPCVLVAYACICILMSVLYQHEAFVHSVVSSVMLLRQGL